MHALIPTSVASGATPAMPIPLTGAPISDETCVPCPLRSSTAALFVQLPFAISDGSAVGVPLKMNEHDRATSTLGAMSGWVKSIPLSITPTLTPSPVACA